MNTGDNSRSTKTMQVESHYAQKWHGLAALMVLVSLLAVRAAAQTYTIADIGTLRHGSARVHDINSVGQIVGASGNPHGGDTHAFFWQQQGGIRDVGILGGGDYSAAFAINDAGQVVGTSNTALSTHAFVWTIGGGLQDLGTLPGANASQAYDINNASQIAGSSGGHAAVWNNGAIQDLGTLPGGDWAEAHGINRNGQVVGVSTTADGSRAFLFSSGSMQNLGTLPGDSGSRADSINDSGVVIGASDGNGGVRAFVWTSTGGMVALGTLSGGAYSEAFGINNLGQIVGQSGSSFGTRAFLWTSTGGMVDLNTLVNGSPNLVLTGAFAINDKGQIVAFGINQPNVGRNQEATLDSHIHSGPTRVFLLTPQ